MRTAVTFWVRLALWTAILLVLLVGASLFTGMAAADVFVSLPVWAGLAIVLAAFPAGLSVSAAILPDGRFGWRLIGEMVAATVAVSVLTFVLAGYAGPATVRWITATSEEVGEPAGMSLPELGREMRSAIANARAAPGPATRDTWLRANRLAWHYRSRINGAVLPFVFGWLGVLMAFWTRLSPRSDLRQVQHWAMGLFLVATTYLMGENSYELIVLNAAGLVDFAADLRLLIPGALLVGFAWPTAVTLWHRHTAGPVT